MKMSKKHNKNTSLIDIFLLITIFSIPFYQLRISLLSTSLSILTVFLFVSCVLLFFYTKKFILHYIKKQRIFSIFTAFFIASFLPSLILQPTMHGFGVFVEWLFFPALTGFLLCAYLQENEHAQKLILTGLAITLSFVSIVSLLLFFSGHVTYDHRLSAFFLSPNHLAMFAAPLLFILVAYFLKEKNIIKKIAIILSLLIGCVTIILTQSLAITVAACLTILICAAILAKKNVYFFLFSFFIILSIIFFTHQKLLSSNAVFERNSFSSRMMIWNTSIYYVQKSPLIGYEIDSFQNIYLDAQSLFDPYLEWAVPTPHNIILTLWLSGGFFAIFAFCTLSAYILFCGFYSYYTQKKRYAIFYCAAFIVILLGGIIDTTYWKNDLAIIFWIIAALIMSLSPSPRPAKE